MLALVPELFGVVPVAAIVLDLLVLEAIDKLPELEVETAPEDSEDTLALATGPAVIVTGM